MTQALMRIDGYTKNADAAAADVHPYRRAHADTGGRRGGEGSISYLDSYRSRQPLRREIDRVDEREIVTDTRATTMIVIDETPLIRLIRTVVIALLVATACMLLVWIANLRATPIPEGPAPLPAAAVVSMDTSAAVGG